MREEVCPARPGRMNRPWVVYPSVFLTVLSLVPQLSAYDVPLTPPAVHDAWVLGQRNDQATAEFLVPYSKQVTNTAPTGPHIAEIEVLTPFAQVVDKSRKNLSDYTEPQAVQDYRQRGDTVVVRIRLMLPGAFPESERSPQAPSASPAQKATLRPENFWKNFQFTVKQGEKTLTPRSIQNKPVYSAATNSAPSTLDGQMVWLEFEAKNVASDEILVEVTTPEAKTVAMNFDLKKLR
jgi:hypothetical protein